jgi:hypothetical protein
LVVTSLPVALAVRTELVVATVPFVPWPLPVTFAVLTALVATVVPFVG